MLTSRRRPGKYGKSKEAFVFLVAHPSEYLVGIFSRTYGLKTKELTRQEMGEFLLCTDTQQPSNKLIVVACGIACCYRRRLALETFRWRGNLIFELCLNSVHRIP